LVSPTLFSSATDEWATPRSLAEALKHEFGFSLDVCASPSNAVCAWYFTKEDNGLEKEWRGHDVIWMNPPYGTHELRCKKNCTKKKCAKRGWHRDTYHPGIKDWIDKASREAFRGATVVCLLPVRTDTKWWHAYIEGKAEVRFIKGRLKFGGAKNSAPFPSCIVIFRGSK
jgi:phage N-6-adenine-methyltransferase